MGVYPSTHIHPSTCQPAPPRSAQALRNRPDRHSGALIHFAVIHGCWTRSKWRRERTVNDKRSAQTNCAEIARTIGYFKTPTQVVELRARSTMSGIIRGLFKDSNILAKYAAKLSGMPDVESINMTMHALDGALESDNIAYLHSRRACT